MRLLRTLSGRIILAYTVLFVASLSLLGLYLVSLVRTSHITNLTARLRDEAVLAAQTTAPAFTQPPDAAALHADADRFGTALGVRITLIGLDGTVLADTSEAPAGMEDHADRPEVVQALRGGVGAATRLSDTVGEESLYVAVPVVREGETVGVARLAVPISRVHQALEPFYWTIALSVFIVAMLSVGLGAWLARRTSRSVRAVAEAARRLAEGDLEHRVQSGSPDETQELADAFNRMAASLRGTFQDLSEERDKLTVLLNTMGDGVVVVGEEGRITLMNSAAEGLLGVTAVQSEGRRFIEVARDYELQGLISQALETRRPQQREVQLTRSRKVLSAISTPLTATNEPGVLFTFHDLTQGRQVETTRREFVSNVSHELRTPIASVKAMVETLESGALEQPGLARNFLDRIHRQIDDMNELVEDLLELSRLESSQDQSETRPLSLRDVLQDVCGPFQDRAQAAGVRLNIEVEDGLPHVSGEEQRLRRILTNLMDNALKFTPSGGAVTISAGVADQHLAVQVRDTGIGIAPEHLPHVFERFYKVDRSRRDGGTGLGLSIVKHAVQSLGGDISIESGVGEGTTFTFTLPIAG
jgi:two-component system phosphate regulon sensor histidine kinase PhoR